MKLQTAQRLLANFIEQAPILIMTALMAGIYFPVIVVYTTWIACLGRAIFAVGYMKSPAYRSFGFIIVSLCQLINTVLAFTSAVMHIQKATQ